MSKRFVDGVRGRGPFRQKPGTQPNILFISFDMVPREFYLPVAGDLVPKTPHLDRLKRDSLFFTNAYATSPLCTPSRASIFTGRYSYIVANGERFHDGQEIHLRSEDTIYPEYLRAAGYRTRHFGKCHVGAGKFIDAFGENDRPWDRWSPPWYDDDGYRSYLRVKGIPGFRFHREIKGGSPACGGRGNFMGGWVSQPDGGDFPTAATYPAYLTELVLRSWTDANGSKRPFYFQVDYFEPHQPFMIPSDMRVREQELYDVVREPASWKSRNNPGFRLPSVYAKYRDYWNLAESSVVEDYLVAHVLQYEILDAQVGRLLERLESEGLYDSTMVILCADHGEMNCRGGLVDKGAYLNPRVLQVPLFIKPANATTGLGSAVDATVSTLDLAPTILAAAGIEADGRFDGVDLLAPSFATAVRPPLVAEVFSHVVPNPAVALIAEIDGRRYLYTFNPADTVDELYLQEDDGSWPERNEIDNAQISGLVRSIRNHIRRTFEADDRWAAYAAYLDVIHHESLDNRSTDLQKFVIT
jgi:arylsulfatase A-like enzyme